MFTGTAPRGSPAAQAALFASTILEQTIATNQALTTNPSNKASPLMTTQFDGPSLDHSALQATA